MKNVNTKTVSQILIDQYGCKVNNQNQLLPEGIQVYDDGYLCNPSDHSSTIHIFTGDLDGWKETNRAKFC